ncbi:Fibrillin-2-like isoform X23 [Oopsacas minuta]|uniref:Fibrillin-2-like isoform X23 n=1 Tax=Oopsacas minuta TaxID=111878 RepID=A0AAV7JAU5_9METZ|nr:Fibrillin-2-like isoform X23 [Oopsacas minuta]
MIIKRRYRRALTDVRDFETEAILKDLKSRLVKHITLILICFFEITAPIFAFASSFSNAKYTLFLFYYSITSTYLTFCLLNILTSYLIRVYTYKPDSRQDRNSLIKFILKLAFTIFLPAIFYLIVFSTLLIILLFIGEIVMFIINGRMLDKVIGWKQQDLALEFGSEGRVLAIKRMRRRFRLFKAVFIACSSFLILAFSINWIRNVYLYFVQFGAKNEDREEMKLIILIFIFTVKISTVSSDSCNVNDVIDCYEPPTSIDLQCLLISPNDSVLQTTLRDCATGNFVTLYLIVIQLTVQYTLNLTMLPDNIQRLSIRGYYSPPTSNDHHVRLITNSIHNSILNIEVFRLSIENTLEESDFFQHFPNVILLRFLNVKFVYNPILQGLSNLEKVYFTGYSSICYGGNIKRVDESLVGGLYKLDTFIWYTGCIEYIMPGAFQDLADLTFLSLRYNLLNSNSTQLLNRDSFRGLSKLTALELNSNEIASLDSKLFNGLFNLEYIDISDNTINCSCELQWVNIVDSFGIDVIGTCDDSGSMIPIQNSSLYTECTQKLSYECFNKSNNCTNECIDTPDSFICGCGEGYGLVLDWDSQTCVDIDECLYDKNDCHQKCSNTLGSYMCQCETGFSMNSTNCTDINECNSNNGGCQQLCINTVGSYVCECQPSYRLDERNVTKCVVTDVVDLFGIQTTSTAIISIITLAFITIAVAGIVIIVQCFVIACRSMRTATMETKSNRRNIYSQSDIDTPRSTIAHANCSGIYESVDCNYVQFNSMDRNKSLEGNIELPAFVSGGFAIRECDKNTSGSMETPMSYDPTIFSSPRSRENSELNS